MPGEPRRALAPTRLSATSMEIFAVAGLLLAILGLHANLSYSVAQRRYEIGLRMAVGATRAKILRLVVLEGVQLGLTGTLIGVMVTVAVWNHFPASTALWVSLGVLAVLTVASYLPARAAANTDPLVTLRGI